MSDLLERLKDAEANKRPHPFRRIDGDMAVAPVYAVHAHDVMVLMLEISNRDARIAELKAALKPFADCGVWDGYKDEEVFKLGFKIADLRAARAALEKRDD